MANPMHAVRESAACRYIRLGTEDRYRNESAFHPDQKPPLDGACPWHRGRRCYLAFRHACFSGSAPNVYDRLTAKLSRKMKPVTRIWAARRKRQPSNKPLRARQAARPVLPCNTIQPQDATDC